MKTDRNKRFIPTPIYIVGENGNIYFKTSCLSALVAKAGFTLVEVLTTLTIIAILLGVLLPALGQVKKFATEAKQKAQIASIDIGVNSFKLDFGYYPPSHGCSFNGSTCTPAGDRGAYCGAQTLAEALVGRDLLGVHRDSIFRQDGKDISSNELYPSDPNSTNLSKRKGPYLDRTNIGVFKPKDIFTGSPTFLDRYMICDAFTAVSKRVGAKTYKIGTPVLYFQANPSAENTQLIPYPSSQADNHLKNIYNYWDNYQGPISAGRITDGKPHELLSEDGSIFYKFIRDPMIPIAASPTNSCGRPVRPDSFILISAGADGLYGTNDDICNFEPNIE